MFRTAPPPHVDASSAQAAPVPSTTESVMGYPVCTQDLADLVEAIDRSLDAEAPPRWMAFLNPHSAVVARDDMSFDRALQEADWVVADGVGIVLASRLQGGRIRDRITGSDFFAALNRRIEARRGSVFFLGSTPENLADIECRMRVDYPGLRVAGCLSPPFKSSYSAEEIDAMVAAINAVKPDVLWVGMTAPKQEKWIHENLHRLDVGVAAGIGAVFDFYTGRVRRSHPVFQRLGLEWLPRLLQQPARLWRRTFVSAPVFLAHALLQGRRTRGAMSHAGRAHLD